MNDLYHWETEPSVRSQHESLKEKYVGGARDFHRAAVGSEQQVCNVEFKTQWLVFPPRTTVQ